MTPGQPSAMQRGYQSFKHRHRNRYYKQPLKIQQIAAGIERSRHRMILSQRQAKNCVGEIGARYGMAEKGKGKARLRCALSLIQYTRWKKHLWYLQLAPPHRMSRRCAVQDSDESATGSLPTTGSASGTWISWTIHSTLSNAHAPLPASSRLDIGCGSPLTTMEVHVLDPKCINCAGKWMRKTRISFSVVPPRKITHISARVTNPIWVISRALLTKKLF